MALLTRSRAEQPGGIPGDLMVQYYSDRASDGGLIIVFVVATTDAKGKCGLRGRAGATERPRYSRLPNVEIVE
jgi:N-ethylmaleimide reductase